MYKVITFFTLLITGSIFSQIPKEHHIFIETTLDVRNLVEGSGVDAVTVIGAHWNSMELGVRYEIFYNQNYSEFGFTGGLGEIEPLNTNLLVLNGGLQAGLINRKMPRGNASFLTYGVYGGAGIRVTERITFKVTFDFKKRSDLPALYDTTDSWRFSGYAGIRANILNR